MTTSNVSTSTNRQAEMFAGSTAMMAEPSQASNARNPDVPFIRGSDGGDTTGSTGGQPGGNPGSVGDPSQPGATGGGDTGNPGGGGMTGSPGGGGGTGTAGGDGGTGSSGGGGGTGTAGGDGGTGSSGGGGGTTTAGGDGGTGSGGGTGTTGGGTGSSGTGGGDGVHLPGLGDLGGILNPVAGAGALLQPIFGAVNTLVNDVNQELGTLGHELGLGQITDAATGLLNTIGLGGIGGAPAADGHTNLLTDMLNAPGAILDGGLTNGGLLAGNGLTDTISHLGADLSDTINAVSSLKDSVIFGSDPSNPVSDLVSGIGHDLQSIPLLTLNGGNNANDGGVLGGIVGSLNGSSTGHLIDVDAGPQQDHGLILNLLNQPDTGPQHTVEVHAVDVGPTGPQLLDLGLLTGGNGVLSDGNGVLSGVTGLLSGGESPLSGVTGLLSGSDGPLSGVTGVLSGNDGVLSPVTSLISGTDGQLSGVTGLISGADGPLSGVTGLLSGGNGALSGVTGLLSDLHVPTLGGTGADGLVGNLLGGASVLSGNSANPTVTAPINVDLVHDLTSTILDHGVLDLHGTHII